MLPGESQGKGKKVSASSNQTTGSAEATSRAVQTVLDALEKLRFGAIQLTVHEGKLVQVDVTERHRYPN
ncbi:MAG: YezD family protein [Sphingopyxis sp.]|nr:YezD family protein [Sphingopyxis sp.]